MKKDRWLLRAVVLLALSAALMSGVSLAAEAGSPQDPLVTLSYLNDTFFSQLMQRVDQRIAERTGQALPGGGASASFVVVTLNDFYLRLPFLPPPTLRIICLAFLCNEAV